MAMVKIADVTLVPPGTGTVVQAGNREIALFNLQGTFYALDNRCTHVGGPLGQGTVEGTTVTCPWHGSQFNITTGEVLRGPARRPVAAYPVHVEGNQVMADLP